MSDAVDEHRISHGGQPSRERDETSYVEISEFQKFKNATISIISYYIVKNQEKW